MSAMEGVKLTVQAAEKRDAGRGIARLPESARRSLNVLSGDTVLVEGDQPAVAKVWPGGPDARQGSLLIDADTRSNAGVRVGDTVRVAATSVEDADRVTFVAPAKLSTVDVSESAVEQALSKDLRDRPLRAGESVHVERLGGLEFVVSKTDPTGTIRVTAGTSMNIGYDTDTARDADSITSPNGDARSPGSDAVSTDTADTGGDDSPRTAYEDIGGLDDELEMVREMIELPLSRPRVFHRLGVDPPKGVLLHGPPGTGKTLIARAVANEVNAQFITVDGPEIMSKYKGESEEQLRDVFEQASEESPTIVFFDEIDSIAGKRDEEADVENRVVGQLLSLMDGLDARGEVIVIGATNRVDAIDPALRRGGRFDREIKIGVPGVEGRREILDVHTRRMPLAENVDLDQLADRTHGFVGADIETLSQEAAMTAIRRARNGGDTDLSAVDVSRQDFETAMSGIEPSAMREYVAETPATDFSEVGGLESAQEKLQRAVTWPLTYGPLFDAAETDPPTGVLLHGPPGTGKTLLARAIAGESQVNFIQVAGPELLDRYVGESEKAVREVFERARQSAPSIIFFDEVDAVASDRDSTGDSGVGERVVSQLLTELDRAADDPNLVVIAATNRRDALDPALLRPGRFETHVEVPHPDRQAREEILDVHTAGKPLGPDIDTGTLAEDTEGFSGAELTAICREAALLAIQDVTDEHGADANEHTDEIEITHAHFKIATDTVAASY